MAEEKFWEITRDLTDKGKCRFFFGARHKEVRKEYLCIGDRFCSPCPDYELCLKRELNDKRIRKLRRDAELARRRAKDVQGAASREVANRDEPG